MFVQLLDSGDEDVQFYCAAALSNLAVHSRSQREAAGGRFHIAFFVFLSS